MLDNSISAKLTVLPKDPDKPFPLLLQKNPELEYPVKICDVWLSQTESTLLTCD